MQKYLFYFFITLYSLFTILVGIKFFTLYPINDFFNKLYEIFVILLIFILSKLIGNIVLKSVFKINKFNNHYEKNVFEFGLGVGTLSLIMFLLGILQLYHPLLFLIIILTVVVIFYKNIIGFCNEFVLPKKDFLSVLILFPIILSLLIMFINCFTPPTFYDSLVYHLAIPEIYLRLHKITFLPYNIYSHFPQNMEMLYTLALAIGSEVTPNFVSFLFGIFVLIGIYSLCKRFFNEKIGFLAMFLFSTTTCVLLLTPSSYVEIGLTFFTLMALYAVLIFWETNENKFLYVSGIFAGLALGTKYTGGITVISVIILFIIKAVKEKKLIWIKHFLIFILFSLLPFLPWGIKNLINVGNPVFPFLYNIIGFKNVPWTMETAKNFFGVLTEYSHKSNIFFELILVPWKIIISPQKFGGGIDILGDFGWVLYFLVLPAIFFVKEKNRFFKIIIIYSGLHFTIWFFTKAVLRFLFPLLPLFVIISSYIIVNIYQQKNLVLKYLLPIIIVVFTISNIFLYFNVQKVIDPFWVAIGVEKKQEYLSRKLRFSIYPAFRYINECLSDNDKILFIGEQRGFYCKKNYVPTNIYAPNSLPDLVNNSKDYKEIIDKLKKDGITHILYNKKEGARISSYGIFNFTKVGSKRFEKLINSLPLIFSFNEVYIFKID